MLANPLRTIAAAAITMAWLGMLVVIVHMIGSGDGFDERAVGCAVFLLYIFGGAAGAKAFPVLWPKDENPL